LKDFLKKQKKNKREGLMRAFKKFFAFIYMILMVAVGVILVVLAAKVISPTQLSDTIGTLNENIYTQTAVGVVGGIFVLLGILAPFRVSRKFQTSKIIAFQNPDGEVTISLSAIEDYIKKVAYNIPDIQDIRSRVNAGRRGINIVCDVTISAGANIPQVTEKIQMTVKNKLHEMIGVEEKINMQMNINKIAKGALAPEPEEKEPEEKAHHVPYREME
jgi:uncharacterized alkaline shock family protein YloU